ncbi:MAG: DUF3320 domain-containing protein, partial [Steroidobacteraceae bacterium]
SVLVEDLQSIRKRVQSGELIVFECTGIATAGNPSLRWACSTAAAYLEEEDSFALAVDLRRAREQKFLPLPSRTKAQLDATPQAKATEAFLEPMPALPALAPELIPVVEDKTEDSPEGRLARWKAKLLDLTLRNRLLNFRPTNSNVALICPDPAGLEDRLSDGKEFRLRPRPAIMEQDGPRQAEVYTRRTGHEALEDLALDALQRNELLVDIKADELDARLTEIFRTAQTGSEEGGANTLYLTFGMLQWKEEAGAEAVHLAPIVLVPVTLLRQSVRSGFRLKLHDDDAVVNPSLIQKLQHDFELSLPDFESLPTDEQGLDIAQVFQVFRLKIAELSGWEVKEAVHLGIFSFTKYLMWKDLQVRQAEIRENRVVRHLIDNPGTAFADGDVGIDLRTLDNRYLPEQVFAPMLSDSSQLRAICTASEGRDIVLVGPPGTGKSQTITNLICHLLASGKSVLFVSEKMAALEVVHRRLSSIGLGPFCLELHSSKANKAGVLKQLNESLEASSRRTVEDWKREADRLATLRWDLNSLVEALHRRYPNDLTVFEAMGTVMKWRDRWTPAALHWQSAEEHDRNQLEALRDTARQMAALAGSLSQLVGHPLAAVEATAWKPTWEQSLLQAASSGVAQVRQVESAVGPLAASIERDPRTLSWQELTLLDELADVLLRATALPAGVVAAALDATASQHLQSLAGHGRAREKVWQALASDYKDSLQRVRANEVESQWLEACGAWWLKAWLGKRRILRQLALHSRAGTAPGEESVEALLQQLFKLNAEDDALLALEVRSRELLGEAWQREATDWSVVERGLEWSQAYRQVLGLLAADDPARIGDWHLRLRSTAVAPLASYREAFSHLRQQLEAISAAAGRSSSLVDAPNAAAILGRLSATLQGWQASREQLQPWCLWRASRARALAAGLGGLVQAVERGSAPLKDMADYFEFCYQSWWLGKALDGSPVLCEFSSVNHERKLEEFKAADAHFQELTSRYVAAVLAGNVPNSSLLPGADTEMGKLRREIQKQRRHIPIRQLLRAMPNLLPRLKPCLLMSPLSVAQYLDTRHAQFDVVVFDEASQIPVWDAVGAIARGRQLVCVGDPKQLPPTNFFNKVDNLDGLAGEEQIEDMESILDECLSVGLTPLSLDWHYRSRHESLITFSNITYYDNRLITFPSPYTEDRAVRFERVQGVYDRGGSRTNRAEADAIVAAIERHYLDPAKRAQSLGVVTFNQAQQTLIQNLLDERRRASQPLDQAIAAGTLEPLFVKNLENVQGDERDVIYFSITYGPDASGRVALNFGPLNQDGGQRRLNVAISRARVQVVIFSTLLPEQVDLSRVRAAGVRDLKNYLDFAIRGARALAEQAAPTGGEAESPLEQQVMQALRDKGWEVHPQVGVSGYRIDLGVVDPRAKGRYLLGVECDGRTYHSAATARDRDRLRQLVLESLGWKIHRIWSTDWWRTPAPTLEKLLQRLDELVASPHDEPPVITEPQVEIVETEIAPESYDVYLPARISGGNPDEFYSERSGSKLRKQLAQVIEAEGPVAEAVLLRRVARAWGLLRTGRRIEERLLALLNDARRTTESGGR